MESGSMAGLDERGGPRRPHEIDGGSRRSARHAAGSGRAGLAFVFAEMFLPCSGICVTESRTLFRTPNWRPASDPDAPGEPARSRTLASRRRPRSTAKGQAKAPRLKTKFGERNRLKSLKRPPNSAII